MIRSLTLVAALCAAAFHSGAATEGSRSSPAARPIQLADRSYSITRLDTIPVIENEYSRRFRFDSVDNPRLHELRDRYQLEKVIAPGENEFQRQLLLMDWVHHRFTRFGSPSSDARGALEVLRDLDQGETFFCTQFVHVMVSSAASLGWVNRPLALRRHQGVARGGSTEHATTEIWSNQHAKWIMLDPTLNLYIEKDGVPLNAWEIRQEWFYSSGTNLVFVLGSGRERYRKAALPVTVRQMAGFGELRLEPDELDKYGFIGYIPNTDLMDSREDWGQMFITKDELCDGTEWHQRTLPANPATDPYFPIGQAALDWTASANSIRIKLRTFTPNFDRFGIRLNGQAWRPLDHNTHDWTPSPGVNRFEARAVNAFGIAGPVSSMTLEPAD